MAIAEYHAPRLGTHVDGAIIVGRLFRTKKPMSTAAWPAHIFFSLDFFEIIRQIALSGDSSALQTQSGGLTLSIRGNGYCFRLQRVDSPFLRFPQRLHLLEQLVIKGRLVFVEDIDLAPGPQGEEGFAYLW